MKCHRCDYYRADNNTCQSKKCATGLDGRVTLFDKLFCSPYSEYERNRSYEYGLFCGEELMQNFVENRCKQLGIDYISIFTSEGE